MPNSNNSNNASDTITVTGKPSTSQAAQYYEYKDYTKTWKNWCPLCGASGKLSDNPKGVYEGEITCDTSKGGCDADYDVCTGGDKSGSYRAYLKDACTGAQNSASSVDTKIGDCGGASQPSGQTTGNVGGSGVLIPDKTFYGLIKQIMGAVDAEFVIANNMAYLLSFKDIYEYRNQFDELIPKIERKDVLQDSLIKNWSTDGFYNAVEVSYADGILKYQHDDLVKQYGENVFYYDFPSDDEETAKAKAQALLSAHVRDYSTDIQMSIFYNEQITTGSWVKVHKSITQISGKTHKEIQQELIKNNKTFSTKRKGITIENLVEKTITQDGITKTIQSITDETGEIFDIEIDNSEYELFFVQNYTCRWDKNNALIMDLELKYGPDTPEDPINATVGGLSSSSGTVSGTALSGNIGELVAQWIKGCKTDLEKAQAIHEGLKAYGIIYQYYYNFNYNTPDECLEHAQNPGLNCGDCAQLTTEAMKQGGLNAYIVLRCDSAHYFTVIEINGQKYFSDLTGAEGAKSTRAWNDTWQHDKCIGHRVDR